MTFARGLFKKKLFSKTYYAKFLVKPQKIKHKSETPTN